MDINYLFMVKKKYFTKYLIICLLFSIFMAMPASVFGQHVERFTADLNWQGVRVDHTSGADVPFIGLEPATYNDASGIPFYIKQIPVLDANVESKAELEVLKVEAAQAAEMELLQTVDIPSDFTVSPNIVVSRENAFLNVLIFPFRRVEGRIEKLLSARVTVTVTPKERSSSEHHFATSSVLASGRWFQVGITSTGIYRLTFSDLKELGLNMSNLDPRHLRIYHNGGGILPERNSEVRHDDLVELPVYVHGESDGVFNEGDYVLFYARGPVVWKYAADRGVYEHVQNAYSDYSYAFITADLGLGKRIQSAENINAQPAQTFTDFQDYQVHESDEFNLANSGKAYYGDIYNGSGSKTFDFKFDNVRVDRESILHVELAGRNFQPARFEVLVNGSLKKTYPVATTTSDSRDPYAIPVGGYFTSLPNQNGVNVTVNYKGVSGTTLYGYVDYISVNAWRSLRYVGSQMPFRNPEALDVASVYAFRLENASQNVKVWDVSNPVAPKVVNGDFSGSSFVFKAMGNIDNEFVAFDGSSYHSPQKFGAVANQNLHGMRNIDYLIVAYPDFVDQANRLKNIHSVIDPDLDISIVTPQSIYNEFSCGAKDVVAIRDFCRMLYLDSDGGKELKYLLLFGDASFDYKNRNGVVDFVPTFEMYSGTDVNHSFVTDDLFGCFDESEGGFNTSLADIGIGRMPVATVETAAQMVDKIERYVAKNEETMRPWRNNVTFFCDDNDKGDGFLQNSETLVRQLSENSGKNFVVGKIYLDAYEQINTPSGQFAPQVNEAINSSIEKGSLVLNYVGHGGEVQLSDERIMQRVDVDSWRNAPKYPLMITGTCEFSRYDDHTRTSLGEYAFLNRYGGMIAMFTTSRVTFGGNNMKFIQGVYSRLFEVSGGDHYRLGDVYRLAKTEGNVLEKCYVLFGDPALRLASPKWKVETVSLNGHDPTVEQDTLKALQQVDIEGVVKDLQGNLASAFNGVVYVSVFDKEATVSTLPDNFGNTKTFKVRNSVVFNGKTSVENGRFHISFIVPRDIAYAYGKGLISYYATNYEVDANGTFDDFLIGGFNPMVILEENPPAIRLFIDDTLFVSGGLTGQNPTLLAFINDESGINTTGAGIGHDITATLSGPTNASYRLNDYFEAELDSQGKGRIVYRLQNLPDGSYTLTLRVWDIYNNSNTATIDFVVANNGGMVIDNPLNHPNPFNGETYFTFGHNQTGNNMDVSIRIFDIMGRHVTTLNETLYGTTARTTPIRWNGCAANGSRLPAGVYIYQIIATNDSGQTSFVSSKLILTR